MKNKTINNISIITSIIILFFAPTLEAKSITIRGAASCEKWIEDRSKDIGKNNEIGTTINIIWFLGYLSGANSYKDFNQDIILNIDPDIIIDWNDKYCRENKTKSLFESADRLIQLMVK